MTTFNTVSNTCKQQIRGQQVTLFLRYSQIFFLFESTYAEISASIFCFVWKNFLKQSVPYNVPLFGFKIARNLSTAIISQPWALEAYKQAPRRQGSKWFEIHRFNLVDINTEKEGQLTCLGPNNILPLCSVDDLCQDDFLLNHLERLFSLPYNNAK